MLSFTLYEFKFKTVISCYMSGEVEDVLKEVRNRLPNLLKFMGENKFLSGETPVYHDFYFFESIQLIIHLTKGAILDEFPALKRFNENMKGLSGLKEYLEKCDDKDLDFNNENAQLNGKSDF